MKVTEVIGWVYEAPRDNLKDIDNEIEQWQDEDYLNDLEETKNAEIEALNDRIEAWDLYL